MEKLRLQVLAQQDESFSDTDSSDLGQYQDALNTNIMQLQEKQTRLAMKVRAAEVEPAEHEVQNHKSIRYYWHQVVAQMGRLVFEREDEEEFWDNHQSIYEEFCLRMSDGNEPMPPSK